MALTGKRLRFVNEYLVDLNGAKACRRAGFAHEHAAQQANKFLRDPEVFEAIQIANEERAARTRASADRVVAELVGLAHSNVLHAMSIDDETGEANIDLRNLTPEQAAAVMSYETETRIENNDGVITTVRTAKIKYHAKTPALSRLAEHCGIGSKDGPSAEDIADDQDPPVASEE